MNANRIELWKGTLSWNARFTGPHAAEIKRLFSTDILPLPYTPLALPEVVLADTQKSNPGVVVSLREAR